MQIHFGNVPEIEGFNPETEGLHRIGGPKGAASLWLASLAGLFLLVVPMSGLCLVLSYFAIPNPNRPPESAPPLAWGAMILALLCYIPLHEFLHLVWHPGSGRSDNSILVVWPRKLQFGVYYEGCMSRSRWLLMRLAPFIFLSILPAIFVGIFQYVALSHASSTFIEVIMVVNTVGCGADAAAALLVLLKVPSSASLCFRGGRAYWRPGMASKPGPAMYEAPGEP